MESGAQSMIDFEVETYVRLELACERRASVRQQGIWRSLLQKDVREQQLGEPLGRDYLPDGKVTDILSEPVYQHEDGVVLIPLLVPGLCQVSNEVQGVLSPCHIWG
jgi:hypothetical protein